MSTATVSTYIQNSIYYITDVLLPFVLLYICTYVLILPNTLGNNNQNGRRQLKQNASKGFRVLLLNIFTHATCKLEFLNIFNILAFQ